MKVLHVIPSISEKDGGPSQAIFPMCAALQAKGISVEVASTDAGLDQDSGLELERLITYKGLPVILFPKQLADSFKYSRPFSRWLDENVTQYDLVHIHAVFNHSSIAAARACRKNGVPYIVRPLGTLDPWSMNQKSFRKRVFWHAGIQRMVEGASAIHYTASGEKEAVENSLNLKNGFVAPLGVNVGVSGSSNAFGEAGGHPFVLVLSRLHPKKELETLIEAFLAAVGKPGLEDWRLVIAGDGETDYVNRLKEVAGNNKPDSPVLFTGWLQDETKEAALRNASLVALVSRQENFGLCIAEAMAHGVPVLVSPQVNLAADIEQSSSGWVAPIDKEELAASLMEVMSDEAGRRVRGRAGKELAQRLFTWEVIAQQLAQVYASIIETRVVAADMRPQSDSRQQRIAQG